MADSLHPELDEVIDRPYPPVSALDHVGLYTPDEVCS